MPFGDLILDELLGLPIPTQPMSAEAPMTAPGEGLVLYWLSLLSV